MTPAQRGERVAGAVLADILPRLGRCLGPVDLKRLAGLVAAEVEQAVLEAIAETRADLFAALPEP